MPYTIETNAADCKGFAVVDESGTTVGCHNTRKEAVKHQRALYVNVPDATRKEGPTVSDVHVDSAMGRVRVKKPDFVKSTNVETLIKQHNKLHEITDAPTTAQLFVHHNIMDEIILKGADCDCSCGAWSEPLIVNNITTELEKLEKSDNPSLSPVKQIIQTGIDNGYKFADVLQMLDVGGYMMVVRPKEIIQIEEPEDESEESEVEDSLSKSILAKIKELLNKVGEPSLAGGVAEGGTATFKEETPQSFVPPKGVQEEAQRALNWIKEGHAGANFTSVGRTRASQLANGEAVSRDTIARMKSYLARHEVDSEGEGYKQGDKGYPSPGRVAYAAWGGKAAKAWVDKLFNQYDLAKSYGSIESVYKADEKRFTLGPWYIPDQADAHNEWTDTHELQNALWNYVKSGDRRIRLQHNKNVVAGEWVEAMTWPYPVTVPMTKADGTSEDITYPAGTVFMGTQWEPWAWELVKKGKLTGYSIGGKAERILVDLPEELEKANPYRDGATGRFTTGGGGASGGAGAPRKAPHTAPRKGMGDIPLTEGNVAEMAGGSAAPHIIQDADGNYMFTPERQALHDKIVQDAVDGKPSQENPVYTVMGGGPASGKSTVIRNGEVKVPEGSVTIDSDGIKEQLPEWGDASLGADAAGFTHEESSYLAKRTQAAAFERSQHVLLDGTGDTSPESMGKKIDAARKAGYSVEGHYVTLPVDMALKNNVARFEEMKAAGKFPRMVPETIVRETHAGVSETFPMIAHRFDKVTLHDTSEFGKPKLVAQGSGGVVDIIDQVAYDAFIAKGKAKK